MCHDHLYPGVPTWSNLLNKYELLPLPSSNLSSVQEIRGLGRFWYGPDTYFLQGGTNFWDSLGSAQICVIWWDYMWILGVKFILSLLVYMQEGDRSMTGQNELSIEVMGKTGGVLLLQLLERTCPLFRLSRSSSSLLSTNPLISKNICTNYKYSEEALKNHRVAKIKPAFCCILDKILNKDCLVLINIDCRYRKWYSKHASNHMFLSDKVT